MQEITKQSTTLPSAWKKDGNHYLSVDEFYHLVPDSKDLLGALRNLSLPKGRRKYPHDLCMPLHNIYLGKGFYSTRLIPATFQSQRDTRDEIFERIRSERFPNKPSRLKSCFVFQDRLKATEKNIMWFSNKRKILKCHFSYQIGFNIHEADANWIPNPENDLTIREIEERARNYWSGEMTKYPCIEILVDGQLYFPEWESFKEYDLTEQLDFKQGLCDAC